MTPSLGFRPAVTIVAKAAARDHAACRPFRVLRTERPVLSPGSVQASLFRMESLSEEMVGADVGGSTPRDRWRRVPLILMGVGLAAVAAEPSMRAVVFSARQSGVVVRPWTSAGR